jgi:hypothetical protein
MPGQYNFPKLKKGNTLKETIMTLLDANDAPIDCEDASILVQVRKSPSDPVVLEWSTEDETITISGDDNNVVTLLEMGPEYTDIVPGIYKYDILVTFADETVETIIEGTLQVTDVISHGS